MNRFINFRILVLLCIATMALIAVNIAVTQVNQGKTRPIKTKHWMKGVMQPNLMALKKGLEDGPAADKGWDQMAMHAAILNEASYVLMADDRCPDDIWANAATQTLRQGSIDALKAIEAKDLDAALAGLDFMGAACGECHSVHKKRN